jgi:WhiB family transcriptional regulator, redox-sensing transcriptional regulator
MTRLRGTGQVTHGGLAPEQKTALDVAADATFNRGVELTGVQLHALLDAASVALVSPNALAEAVRGNGDCSAEDADPEDWFPVVGDSARRVERDVASRLCRGCPVRRECLAWSFDGAHGAYGVWGGLGVGDRRELRALWVELRTRLSADGLDGGAGSAVAS